MVNESRLSREKLVYSASDNSHSDLFMGMGERLMDFMEGAHWASNRQIQIGIRGFATRRYTTLEKLLKRKTKRGDLRVAKYGKINLYAKPIKTRNADLTDTAMVYHGFCCTECLIRFMTAKAGDVQSERLFRGYGRAPEFAIRYESGKMILVEFSTKHDVDYSGKIRGKLFGYDQCLTQIEEDFNAQAIVVFILDVKRDKVKKVIEKYQPSGHFYFTDFETFKSVPLGRALMAPIYFSTDGKEYSLTK